MCVPACLPFFVRPIPSPDPNHQPPPSTNQLPTQSAAGWEDDREVLAWMAEHRGIEERIQAAGRARVAQQVGWVQCVSLWVLLV